MDRNITDDGRIEHEVYRRALHIASAAQVPLMVHHTNSTIPLGRPEEEDQEEQEPLLDLGENRPSTEGGPLNEDNGMLSCPGSLRPGDIYTHVFHGHKGTILMREEARISGAVKRYNETFRISRRKLEFPLFSRARRNGVIMDVGHGQGSFDWGVAEAAIREGFLPDVISTDLHSGNVGAGGTAKDLAHVMSKFLALGMSIEQVLEQQLMTLFETALI